MKSKLSADTPLKCLNRMAEAILKRNERKFRDEIQYFWNKGWKINEIPDPEDTDSLKYALKACIVERMKELWNMPPKNRSEILPDWCNQVSEYPSGFSVIEESYRKYFKPDDASPVFERRNIFAPKDFMFFV